MTLAPYMKAVVAFLLAGLTAIATALSPDPVSGVVAITAQEWVTTAIAALTTTGVVWAVPNKTSSRKVALEESAQYDSGSHGHTSNNLLLTVVLILVGIAALIYIISAS